MANEVELLRMTTGNTYATPPTRNTTYDPVAMAEKVFHKLQQPEQIRSKLGEILDISRDKLDQVIITPAERQLATVAHSTLVQFLRGTVGDRTYILTNARVLAGVIGRAGDVPLSRALNTGINALLKRQFAH